MLYTVQLLYNLHTQRKTKDTQHHLKSLSILILYTDLTLERNLLHYTTLHCTRQLTRPKKEVLPTSISSSTWIKIKHNLRCILSQCAYLTWNNEKGLKQPQPRSCLQALRTSTGNPRLGFPPIMQSMDLGYTSGLPQRKRRVRPRFKTTFFDSVTSIEERC